MIVPVKRANIIFPKEEKLPLLLALQRQAIFMVKGFNTKNSAIFNNDMLVKTEKVIKILTKHQKKKPLFATISVSENDFNKTDANELDKIDHVIELENRKSAIEERVKTLEESNKAYANFTFLSISQDDLESAQVVTFKAFKAKIEKQEYLVNGLATLGVEVEYGAVGNELFFVVPFVQDIAKDLEIMLNGAEVEAVKLPLCEIPYSEAINVNVEKMTLLNKELDSIKNELAEETVNLPLIKTYYDKQVNQLVRDTIPHKETENFIYLEGYVREDRIPQLQALLEKESSGAELEIVENPEEVLPTALKNNKFVQPFESITNSFSVPSNKEADPNPAMSVWYWLFFGIMFADLGYGLILLAGTILMLKLLKPKGGLKQLLQVFMYSSISAIAFGAISGSIFGVDLAETFPNIPFISPVSDPMLVLIISLVLGAFHLMTALVFKAVKLIKEKDILGALAEAVSWILILLFGMLYIADMMNIFWNSIPFISYLSLGLVLLGVVFIVFLSGRGSKNVIGWVAKGFGGIYGATSYLSDILSYSRLLALMLSGAVIGSTMNLLAGMVSGAFFGVGIIFSILIIIVGHLFNFAMGLLSAYVHGGRLQYLEFFGKFYEGGGIAFEPLSYQLHYINEIKEN